MKPKRSLQKINRFYAAMVRVIQAVVGFFVAAAQSISSRLGGGKRHKAFLRAKSNRRLLSFGALRAGAAGLSAAMDRGMQTVVGFFSAGTRAMQTAVEFFRAAAQGVRRRLGGGRRQNAFFAAKVKPLCFGALREKAGGLFLATARGMQKAIWFLGVAVRNVRRSLGGRRRQEAFFRANRKPLPSGALRAKAGGLLAAMARCMQAAKEIFGSVIPEFRNRYGGGYRPAGFIAAVVVVIAAACVLPALAGESEAALIAQAFNPEPVVLYYPRPIANPEPAYVKAREIETLYGGSLKEEDKKTAEPPKEEDNKTAEKPEAQQVRLDTPKKEMSVKEMFKKEFPHENYSKTKKILARVIHGEGKGTKSITNRAAIVETVLNRVDAKMRGDTPYECATAHGQFCVSGRYTKEELWIAGDVLKRWLKIRRGEDAEWILPKSYLWFHGTYPRHDWTVFRNKYHFRDKPRYKTPLHSKIYGD